MSSKRALRFFNTTGPCNPDDHYMLPPENRLAGTQLSRYIRDKLYWDANPHDSVIQLFNYSVIHN